jgi:poly-gamma-glutamate capsule biosynthesis protein CapA/YwtB (metallophosphatase superfamily)
VSSEAGKVGATRRDFLSLAAAAVIAPTAGQAADLPADHDKLRLLRKPAGEERTIVLGGDYFLDHRLSEAANPAEVFDVFREADASFANLEGGLSTVGSADLGGFKWGPNLRGNPALVSELKWAGIRAVSVANNHTGNFGREALLETLSHLDKAGIAHSGAGRNIDEAFAACCLDARGLKVGICSFYSYIPDIEADDVATEQKPGIAVSRADHVVLQPAAAVDTSRLTVAPSYLARTVVPPHYDTLAPRYNDLQRMKNAVSEAAGKADLVVVSIHFHWGFHGKSYLPPLQRTVAQELIDAGADLFVGHGPHTVRGVEIYKQKPIIYSVGNLVLRDESKVTLSEVEKSINQGVTHQGMVARVIFERKAVREVELLPISILPDGCPQFAAPERAMMTTQRVMGLSAALDTDVAAKEWFGVVKP